MQGGVEGADRDRPLLTGVRDDPGVSGVIRVPPVRQLVRSRQRPQVPGEFVGRVVLRVRQVVGQGAAVQRVAVLAELRPQAQQPLPGLLAVAAVVQHDDLSDPRQQSVRRRLLLSLRHRVLRTRQPP